jgi:hypothetical protein
MHNFQLNTPVAFLVFNRPETTIRVFEEIRRTRPPKLLVVADGPRADRQSEVDKCQAVRAIIDTVDWPCDVLKNYSDTNLGCGRRVSSGLDWVFQTVEEAIILEDDCLPHQDFFYFCEELLNRYRYDDDVISIGGTNFLKGIRRGKPSYYFSSHFHVWGWASWKRAWDRYDYEARDMTEERLRVILDRRFISSGEKRLFENMFMDMKARRVDTWDYQWLFTHLFSDGLTIIPNANLVTNIGPCGTHFSNSHKNPLINLPTGTIFPWVLNKNKKQDKKADLLVYRLNYKQNIMERFLTKIMKSGEFIDRKYFFGAVKKATKNIIRR